MSRTLKTLTIAVAMFAAVPAIGVFAAPAASAQQRVHAQVTVSYGDLDLTKEAGIGALMDRLDKASAKVCGGRPSKGAYGQISSFKTCRDAAIEDAVRRIGAPGVTIASSR